MKLQTFNKEIIAHFMANSSALEKGIEYMKSIQPGVSDDIAKKSAISQAQEFCYQKWLNDRSGYIDSEWKAFSEFEKDVSAGRYFSSKYTNVNYSDKSHGLCLFLCFFLGLLGVHRFYVGKKKSGWLYLFTFGCFGYGWLFDLVSILLGFFTDVDGNYL